MTPRMDSNVVVALMDSSVVVAPLTKLDGNRMTRLMVHLLPILGLLHVATPNLGPIVRFVAAFQGRHPPQ